MNTPRTRALVCAAALAAALGAAGPALAQRPGADDPRSGARMHLGPFYVTPKFVVDEIGVDTNVFNESGDQKSDFTVAVTPGVDLSVPVARRGLVKASASSGLVYYRAFAGERSVNGDLSLAGELYLNRITLFGGGSLLNTRQRPNFEIDARSRRVERAVEGGVDIRAFPRLHVELAARQSDVRFDGDAVFAGTYLEESLNRESRTIRLRASYLATALTTVVVAAETTQDRFEFSPERNTNTLRLLPGVEFHPRALVSGRAYVGYRSLTAPSPAVPDLQEFVATAGLSYRFAGSTVFSFDAGRDVSYSFDVHRPYFLSNSYGGRVRRALGPRFDVEAGAQRHKYSYRNLVAPAPAGAGPDASAPGLAAGFGPTDTTRAYSAAVGYRVGRTGRVATGATYWERQSSQSGRTYDRFQVGTSVTYGF